MKYILAITALIALIILVLILWRAHDVRAQNRLWLSLACTAPETGSLFTINLIQGLPEPAQRYFRYTIEEGTSLRPVSIIEMTGELGLGGKETPNYKPMRARQILAPPHGFIWAVTTPDFIGSDAAGPATSWTRFWLKGILPIVRAGGDPDHFRSAFGRYVAEAVIWAPASLLPDRGGDTDQRIYWDAVDANTARVTVNYYGIEQTVDVSIDEDGKPLHVEIPRWSNENADKVFQLQPFGGALTNFKNFEGYRLPTHVEAGNHFGTELYYPFFKADVQSIEFVTTGPDTCSTVSNGQLG